MHSLFQSVCIVALVTGGLACAGTVTDSNQNPDTSDLSSLSMDGTGDPGMVNTDSQPSPSNPDLPQGPLADVIGVHTNAVPSVPEPSTVLLIGGAACAAFIGRRKLARR